MGIVTFIIYSSATMITQPTPNTRLQDDVGFKSCMCDVHVVAMATLGLNFVFL